MSSNMQSSQKKLIHAHESKLKLKKSKHVSSSTTLNLEETKGINKREIFISFFNALIEDIILSREIIRKTVDDLYCESRDNQATEKTDDGTDKKISMPMSANFKQRKPHHEGQQNFKGSLGSAYSSKYISKVKKKPSLENQIVDSMSTSNFRQAVDYVVIEKIVFKNGNEYEGTCNEYLMDGKGTFTWTDKTIYTGEFKDGFITGKGELTLPDLSKYRGENCRGVFHGNGYLNLLGTTVYYSGSWKNGKKDGNGWIIYQPDDWYEGEWKNDLRHGFGYRRYKNGSKYKGQWFENKKQGEGKMLWENMDYYSGGWVDDKPHGYGEYIWDLSPNDLFCFPLQNTYNGSWVKGFREGVGVMNFGTDSGAKYAGMWIQNRKHGAGVMICGNGNILESNPLFEFNKPVHKSSQKTFAQLCEEDPETNYAALASKNGTFYDLLNMNMSKKAYLEIPIEILVNITINGEKIPPSKYVKLADSISGNKREWCPLDIPIYTVAQNVDFNYFIDIIFDYAKKFYNSSQFLNFMEASSEVGVRFRRSFMHNVVAEAQPAKSNFTKFRTRSDEVSEKIALAKERELVLFSNLILTYLSKLKRVYNKYASFAQEVNNKKRKLPFTPILIRILLWQLLRDAQVHEEVQLINVDVLLWENPRSCLQREFYPFEKIYFYQFVQYLMGCAWLIYKNNLENNPELELVFPSKIFKDFLERFFQNIGSFSGSALTEHLDLVPITKVYHLYKDIGEPMSVRTFLYSTYREKHEKLPCFTAINSCQIPPLVDGNNVPMGHIIHYMQAPEPIAERIDTSALESEVKNTDKFAKSLLTFRTLGKEKILQCLINICPKIIANLSKIDMNYNLNFLEFYEVVLMCAFFKAEELVQESLKSMPGHVHSNMPMELSSFESIRSRSKLTKKEKKRKKNVNVSSNLGIPK